MWEHKSRRGKNVLFILLTGELQVWTAIFTFKYSGRAFMQNKGVSGAWLHIFPVHKRRNLISVTKKQLFSTNRDMFCIPCFFFFFPGKPLTPTSPRTRASTRFNLFSFTVHLNTCFTIKAWKCNGKQVDMIWPGQKFILVFFFSILPQYNNLSEALSQVTLQTRLWFEKINTFPLISCDTSILLNGKTLRWKATINSNSFQQEQSYMGTTRVSLDRAHCHLCSSQSPPELLGSRWFCYVCL